MVERISADRDYNVLNVIAAFHFIKYTFLGGPRKDFRELDPAYCGMCSWAFHSPQILLNLEEG